MYAILRTTLAAAGLLVATQAAAQVTFYEHDGYQGRSFTTGEQIRNFERVGFNDRASSVVVQRDQWMVCEDARLEGQCVILRPGRYPSLSAMGLNDRISSVRRVAPNERIADYRYAPPPPIINPGDVPAQLTFYEREGFDGRAFTTADPIGNLERFGFNDRASSVVVLRDQWVVCENARFDGRCVILSPGRYPSLAAMGLNDRISSVRRALPNERVADIRYAPPPVATYPADGPPQITFYEREGFDGRTFSTADPVGNLERFGFNDRASSIVVRAGEWMVCEHAQFDGRCVTLRPGQYPNLAAIGLSERISSVRAINRTAFSDERYLVPTPVAAYDYSRRPDERLYEANVTSVRAVVGPPEQRCWVEREQIALDRRSANVPGAIAGALIGGIIGHQIGSGRGNDAATIAGAIGGAVLGSNVSRDASGRQVVTQNVQRCAGVSSEARPAYWDVTYRFRGVDHRMQMSDPPGATVIVNALGEPRA